MEALQVTAIIAARGGSVRLPGKALLPFAGTTLIGHKIDTLKACRLVSRIVVGSDSDAILDEATVHGAEAIRRDDYHCDERVCTANEMLADLAEKVGGDASDVILWAHPTNPLVLARTYDDALEIYEHSHLMPPKFDSLCSVHLVQRHAWIDHKPFNYDPWAARHAPAKDLKLIAFQNGAIFIQTRGAMLTNRYFFGRKPFLYAMTEIESTDIDTREDYELALCRHAFSALAPASRGS